MDEKLILGEKQVLNDLNSLENKSKVLIAKIPIDAIHRFFNLENKTPETVRTIVLQLLQQALHAVWLAGWNLGVSHSQKEIDIIKPRTKKFFSQSNIIQFAQNKANIKERPIRNMPAENAIKGRINQLASDVASSEYALIKNSILAAITPRSGTGVPISRSELINQIEDMLGTKSGRYANRAETIARTELTFAYNAGRLDTYQHSNLVKAVRYYTISDERRCDICASRQGLVIPLENASDVTANTPPLHPRCRCVLSPVLKDSKELQESDRAIEKRELVPRPVLWAAAGILAAVLVGKVGSSLQDLKQVARIATAAKAVASINLRPSTVAKKEDIPGSESQQEESQQEEPQLLDDQHLEPQQDEPQQSELSPQELLSPTTAPRAARVRLMAGSVDLNSATREQLQQLLPGRSLNVRQVNEIIRKREQHPFTCVDDLQKVPGIGGKTLERLRQLVEGSEIFIFLDPRQIKSPVQLWASNLGLTRAQAQTIFDEMQKGSFRDFDDLRTRLAGRGVGEKTIENMQQRAIVIQQSIRNRINPNQ